MQKKPYMLTTSDNPFNPFDDFKSWLAYDIEKGYNTSQYLARVSYTSDALPEEVNQRMIEKAIDEIVELNILGIYKRIYEKE